MDVDNRQLRCVTNLHVASARPEAPSTPRAEKRVRPWPARLPVAALALAKAHHGSHLTPSLTSGGGRYVPLALSVKRAGEEPGRRSTPASDQFQSHSAPC